MRPLNYLWIVAETRTTEDSKRTNIALIFKTGKKTDSGHWRESITGTNSSLRQISGGVPKSSILDPTLFNTFINDLDDRVEHVLGKLLIT